MRISGSYELYEIVGGDAQKHWSRPLLDLLLPIMDRAQARLPTARRSELAPMISLNAGAEHLPYKTNGNLELPDKIYDCIRQYLPKNLRYSLDAHGGFPATYQTSGLFCLLP